MTNRSEFHFQTLAPVFGAFCFVPMCSGYCVEGSVLHITDRDFLQGRGDARTIRTVPLVANRGLITDRNGEPLAVSTPVQSIWVNPTEVAEEDAAIAILAQELELNAEALASNIKSNSSRDFSMSNVAPASGS
ncbi:MAG: hypothetical protein CM1200mP40_29160 [Gammaproteobacteria bacterium]|nr:MAG: hypothetical protein CM1200mP40_29160 [Gammaproteobacteria bacterium]